VDTGRLTVAEGNLRVRTVDSYMMRPNYKFQTVYIDEVCMVHYGVVVAVCVLGHTGVGVPQVRGYGDRLQIPYINFAKSFSSFVSSFTDWTDTKWISVSRRIPQDVAVALLPLYKGGLKTTSNMKTSMTRVKIDGLAELPYKRDAQYMAFTNTEAHQIRVAGEKMGLIDGKKSPLCSVLTVHRVQGKTIRDKEAILVRLNPLSNSIYKSQCHAIVAISRHCGVSFTYMTVSDEVDRVSQFIAYSKSAVAMEHYKDVLAVSDGDNVKKSKKQGLLTGNK